MECCQSGCMILEHVQLTQGMHAVQRALCFTDKSMSMEGARNKHESPSWIIPNDMSWPINAAHLMGIYLSVRRPTDFLKYLHSRRVNCKHVLVLNQLHEVFKTVMPPLNILAGEYHSHELDCVWTISVTGVFTAVPNHEAIFSSSLKLPVPRQCFNSGINQSVQ